MKPTKLWLFIIGICLTATPGCASEERVSVLLRSMANGGPVPTEKAFYEAVDVDYLNKLPPDSISAFLPLAGKLLRDSRPEARRYGLVSFLAVTLRQPFDSEPLLEPYVPDLLTIVSDRASVLRPMAMEVLGNSLPRLSPKTRSYLAAHLADNDNTAEDTGWMACMLLKVGTDSLTRDVIAFVRKQDKPEVIQEVLKCFRVLPIATTSDVISLIGSGLDSPDLWVRRRAVEAVARLSLVERSAFLAQLSRLATDSREATEIRAAAAEALKK